MLGLEITEESYFGLNKERHTYVESVRILDKLEGDDGDGNDGKSKAYREQLEQCRKALMRRAMTCVRRLWKLHADRDSVYALMRAGSIDEVVWQQFKAAENHLQMEIYDIQAESETFKDGWSQAILREAAELCRKEDQLTEMLKTVNKRQQKQPKPAPSTATSPSSNNGGSIVVEEVSDEDD
jgi:hypothetical protein